MKRLQVYTAALLAGLLLTGCAESAASPAATQTPQATAAASESAPAETPAPADSVSFDPLTGLENGDYTNRRPVAVALRTIYGAAPQWGVEAAEVLVEGVSVGTTPSLMALYPSADSVPKAGPVGEANDLMLQFALPLNAVPVHIGKNVYADNLLNALSYQDVDGLHTGKTAFAFDSERQLAGYREENCWYTTGELVRAGLDSYGTSADGANTPLFRFGQRKPVAEADRNGTTLTITFSTDGSQQLIFDPATGLYTKTNTDGTPFADADSGAAAAFTNVFVLYASSGVKDDGHTRQYDLTGGAGLYLTGGAWEPITWAKQDATAPLELTAADGSPLVVSPGKSYIAVWGGYYSQKLALTAADGTEQALPEKPALLESGISDEAAAAAQQELDAQQARIDAQAAIDQANADIASAQAELDEVNAALADAPENADLLARRDALTAQIEALNQTVADNQALLAG